MATDSSSSTTESTKILNSTSSVENISTIMDKLNESGPEKKSIFSCFVHLFPWRKYSSLAEEVIDEIKEETQHTLSSVEKIVEYVKGEVEDASKTVDQLFTTVEEGILEPVLQTLEELKEKVDAVELPMVNVSVSMDEEENALV